MKIKTRINSEIGKLEGVILHQPGPEVENMTPENAERALYSDILNLTIALHEFNQLKGVLDLVCNTYEVKELLQDILNDKKVKDYLLKQIFKNQNLIEEHDNYTSEEAGKLAQLLIEGVPLEKNNLTRYLNRERFLLPPLHNLFFTRDASMGMNEKILVGKMASPVRERESVIMDAIFNYHPLFETRTINPELLSQEIRPDQKITIEGGDFLVFKENIFVIGAGPRTSTQGIDFLIEKLKAEKKGPYYIIVQELPSQPESFIHLDMVFTILNNDECMVYEPVIFEMNRYRTIQIVVNNKDVKINEEPNILKALQKIGIVLKPIACGGTTDRWIQEREQWHSGANFFAFAPGKLIGYERNVHTIEELSKNGYDVLKATDIISGKTKPEDYNKCVVTIEGAELARGGGGARC
ncbi:MAG: arginine deiminase, partial [Prolixibacteraceae bacterium]|nr:arginine deiminase [Prolixibacteraceae bacterium]